VNIDACAKTNVMTKYLLFVSLILLGFSVLATGGDDEPIAKVQYKEGVVKNYSAMGEGCDWLIEMDGRIFKPKNLKDAFKKDGLRVKMDFEFSLSLYQCKEMKEKVQEINIHWIEVVNTKAAPGEKVKLVPAER